MLLASPPGASGHAGVAFTLHFLQALTVELARKQRLSLTSLSGSTGDGADVDGVAPGLVAPTAESGWELSPAL